jgi:hypothetical protein
MTNETNKNEVIARYFSSNNFKAHIVRKNGKFSNGLIKEVSPEFFIIDDVVEGHQVVFFAELKNDIEEYQEMGK